MRANVCGPERRVRGIVGVLLIIVGFIVAQTAGWIIGIIGLVLLLTAMLSYCPINAIFGRNSCRAFIRDPLRDREMTY
jgi:uncharacterized membrane protein